MKCKVEKTENANEVKLELTIEAQKFDEAIQKVYFKSAKYFNIPGFRKGKAPMSIVEKYYGKEIFYEDAFNEVAPEELETALKENKIEAVSRPDIDVKQIEKGKDLIFTAVFQTKPEAELGKYKGIEIPKIEYTVSDEDINHELSHMQEHNSRLISIDDRPVEKGDITVIDFEGFVDGKAFEGGKAEGHELEIGSGTFIPGFEEQLIGMELENEKEIKLTTLEFDLLLLLMNNKNKSFSRDEILNSVWGDDYFGSDRVVDDLIRRLRKKMKKLNVNTVYGYGYRLS